MNDSLDHATGLEKRELLARQAGREVIHSIMFTLWETHLYLFIVAGSL